MKNMRKYFKKHEEVRIQMKKFRLQFIDQLFRAYGYFPGYAHPRVSRGVRSCDEPRKWIMQLIKSERARKEDLACITV